MSGKWIGGAIGLLLLAGAVGGGRYATRLQAGTGSGKRASANNKRLNEFEELIEEDEQIARLAKHATREFRGTKLAAVVKVQFSEKTKDDQPLGAYLKELAGRTGGAVRRLRNGWNNLTGLQQRRFQKLQQRADAAIKEMDRIVPGIAESYARKADIPLWGETRGRDQRPENKAARKLDKQPSKQQQQQARETTIYEVADSKGRALDVDPSIVRDTIQEDMKLKSRHGAGSRGYWDAVAKDADLMAYVFLSDDRDHTMVGSGKVMSPNFRTAWQNFRHAKGTTQYLNSWARALARYRKNQRSA